jgi:hypothetical protein
VIADQLCGRWILEQDQGLEIGASQRVKAVPESTDSKGLDKMTVVVGCIEYIQYAIVQLDIPPYGRNERLKPSLGDSCTDRNVVLRDVTSDVREDLGELEGVW